MENKTTEIIAYIQQFKELSPEEKNKYIEMLQSGTDPMEILDLIEDNIQEKIDALFQEAGVELDEKDPEYQAAFQEMEKEMTAAQNDFQKEMEEIEKEAKNIQDDTVKQIDDAKIKAIQDSLQEK